MAANQKIRIKLKAYDHAVLDQSAEKIVKRLRGRTGAKVSGTYSASDRQKLSQSSERTISTRILVSSSKKKKKNSQKD